MRQLLWIPVGTLGMISTLLLAWPYKHTVARIFRGGLRPLSKPLPATPGPREQAYAHDLQSSFDKAGALMQSQSWAAALALYRDILQKDPLQTQARLGLLQAQRHLQEQTALTQAQQALQQGLPNQALASLAVLGTGDPIRIEVLSLREKARISLSQQAVAMADKSCQNRVWDACALQASFALTYAPQSTQALALVTEAENALADQRRPFVPWDPVHLRPTAWSQRHPQPSVREAMLRYASGHVDQALERLQKLRSSHRSVAFLIQRLTLLKQAQAQGDAAEAAGDLQQAVYFWNKALHMDRSCIPAGQPSVLAQSARDRVAMALLHQGERAFNRGLYGEALRSWQAGLEAEPHHQELLKAILRLESRASSLFGSVASLNTWDEAACRQLQDIVAMTRPNHPAHRKAQDKLLHCKKPTSLDTP